MSEEKLYAVRNADGTYWDMDPAPWWDEDYKAVTAVERIALTSRWAKNHGGHVVTLIEEPEKVVLTKEQAEIVEEAHASGLPATYISINAEDGEELLINAYVNGYNMAKGKRYLVELDGLVTTDGAKQYLTKKDGKWFACRRMPGMHQDFTDEELNKAPEWAQQLDCEEVPNGK